MSIIKRWVTFHYCDFVNEPDLFLQLKDFQQGIATQVVENDPETADQFLAYLDSLRALIYEKVKPKLIGEDGYNYHIVVVIIYRNDR